jgi:hypothetical protein
LNPNDINSLKNADPTKGALEGSDRTQIAIDTTNRTRDSKPVLNERLRQSVTPRTQNESIVQEVDEKTLPIPDHTNTDVSQYRVYDNDDDAYNDFVNKGSNPQPVQQPKTQQKQLSEAEQTYEDEKVAYGIEEANRRRDIRLKRTNQPVVQSQREEKTIQQQMTDPSEMMFKTFKRNHEIQINVSFKEKIGKPEFIKMMMENMEGDIVGYYKKLIVDDIMNNFKVIEDEVEKQIKEEIFGVDEKQLVDIQSSINKIVELSKKIIDKSDEISFNDGLDDDEESVQTTTVDDFEFGDEETENEPVLIPGGLTPTGKQLYKYIDGKGKIKESLPETAIKKGWTPLTKQQ